MNEITIITIMEKIQRINKGIKCIKQENNINNIKRYAEGIEKINNEIIGIIDPDKIIRNGMLFEKLTNRLTELGVKVEKISK